MEIGGFPLSQRDNKKKNEKNNNKVFELTAPETERSLFLHCPARSNAIAFQTDRKRSVTTSCGRASPVSGRISGVAEFLAWSRGFQVK